MLQRKFRLKRYTPLRAKRKPASRSTSAFRDAKYLKWIRSLPCSVDGCESQRRIQAAHTGPHGMSIKAPDASAIPLCPEHHLWEYAGSYHRLGRSEFERRHGLNVQAIASSLNALYLRRCA